MSYHDRLRREINEALDGLATEGKVWDATWVAHKICLSHEEGVDQGFKGDFWRHCGYATVRREVREAINSRADPKPNETIESQYMLPGYKHLQNYYVVERNGSHVGVPIYHMTGSELGARATMYRSMGQACIQHATELERFRRLRA